MDGEVVGESKDGSFPVGQHRPELNPDRFT